MTDWTLDTSLKGVRCRPLQNLRCFEGSINVSTEGTIVYEVEGYAGVYVCVYWDNGINALVAPEKIVITDEAIHWH